MDVNASKETLKRMGGCKIEQCGSGMKKDVNATRILSWKKMSHRRGEAGLFQDPAAFQERLQVFQELNIDTSTRAKSHYSLSLEARNSSK